jgi:hypothetical protein
LRVGIHGPDINAALQETHQIAAKLGAEGWEMVNDTTDHLAGSRPNLSVWLVGSCAS